MATKRITKKAALTALMPRTDAEVNMLILSTISSQTLAEVAIAKRDEALAVAAAEIERKFGYDKVVAEAQIEVGRNVELLEMWADQHPDLFGKLKSIKRGGAVLGWRAGQWKTELKRGLKWDAVVDALKEMVDKADEERTEAEPDEAVLELGVLAQRFLRWKVEPNKDSMIEARDEAEALALLEHAGVMITQDERFFFEPEREGQSGPGVVVEAGK
jgi:hypothetical protein